MAGERRVLYGGKRYLSISISLAENCASAWRWLFSFFKTSSCMFTCAQGAGMDSTSFSKGYSLRSSSNLRMCLE